MLRNVLYYILLALLTVMIFTRCNRKLHTSETVDSTAAQLINQNDSLRQATSTLSEAYEELLRSSSETGVVFNTRPCDTIAGKVGGSGMPHIVIRPDGTREFTGPILRFNDKQTKQQETRKTYFQEFTDLYQRHQSLINSYASLHATKERTVKTKPALWWLWLIPVVFLIGALAGYRLKNLNSKLNPLHI